MLVFTNQLATVRYRGWHPIVMNMIIRKADHTAGRTVVVIDYRSYL